MQIEEYYSSDRLSATATAKSDVTRLQVKVEGLQAQVNIAIRVSMYNAPNSLKDLKQIVKLETRVPPQLLRNFGTDYLLQTRTVQRGLF